MAATSNTCFINDNRNWFCNSNKIINAWSYRSTPGQNPLLAALARRKRALGLNDDEDIEDIDEENNPHIANILTRTVADDQLEILKVSLY